MGLGSVEVSEIRAGEQSLVQLRPSRALRRIVGASAPPQKGSQHATQGQRRQREQPRPLAGFAHRAAPITSGLSGVRAVPLVR